MLDDKVVGVINPMDTIKCYFINKAIAELG
jgi:hypothetical protein